MYISTMFLYLDCSCLLEGVTNNGDCAKEDNGILQPGDCYCKANVIGRACDMCALGYYNLSADNPDGCQGTTYFRLLLSPPPLPPPPSFLPPSLPPSLPLSPAFYLHLFSTFFLILPPILPLLSCSCKR